MRLLKGFNLFLKSGAETARICTMSRLKIDSTHAPVVTPFSPQEDGPLPETSRAETLSSVSTDLFVTKNCETCGKPFVSRPCQKRRFCGRRCKYDSPRVRQLLSESAKARKGGTGPFSSKGASERMKAHNPTKDPLVREKIAKSKRARGDWRPPVQGGNGRSMPVPQQILLEALGPEWVSEKRFPWGASAIPAYLADIAHEQSKIVVEVDGENHRDDKVRARDARKDTFLSERGWFVLRVSNREVLENLDTVVASITSALQVRRTLFLEAEK